MKGRKLLSVLLAVSMLCSMVVVVSAASAETIGEYDDCVYSTFTSCGPSHYSSIMEFQYISNSVSTKDSSDYYFKSDVRVFDSNGNAFATIYGTYATELSSNYSEFEIKLGQIVAFFYVNYTSAGDVTVLAGNPYA